MVPAVSQSTNNADGAPEILRASRALALDARLTQRSAVRFVRLTLLLISTAVGATIAWASVTEFPEIAATDGEVVPSGQMQAVQHLEGGIIAELFVAEGDLVKKDELLARFDSANASAELERMRARRAALGLKHERLRARATGEQPDFARITEGFEQLKVEQQAIAISQEAAHQSQRDVVLKQISQRQSELATLVLEEKAARQRIALIREEVKMRTQLAKRGYDSRLELVNTKERLVAAEASLTSVKGHYITTAKAVEELRLRMEEVDRARHETIMQELGTTSAELAETDELIRSLTDRVQRLEVHAPVSGIVQHLPMQTKRGVLPPGGVVAELVPATGELVVETRIAPRDIGFVHSGQAVRLKFQAYDFSRFGAMDGELKSLSATTFLDDQGVAYYKARVSMADANMGAQDRPVLPGMTVQADIITGSKTLLQYLLKPIHRNLDSAFAER